MMTRRILCSRITIGNEWRAREWTMCHTSLTRLPETPSSSDNSTLLLTQSYSANAVAAFPATSTFTTDARPSCQRVLIFWISFLAIGTAPTTCLESILICTQIWMLRSKAVEGSGRTATTILPALDFPRIVGPMTPSTVSGILTHATGSATGHSMVDLTHFMLCVKMTSARSSREQKQACCMSRRVCVVLLQQAERGRGEL
mmetsp:Transcript_33965/g.78314  ORF Transcript_33965/g.78314 Transcript_33965/m.78314 type:complete len:201 (-) Transcript_33965:90-692(-)